MKEFIRNLPKAELHLHIEGSLEPELMFTIAKRNDALLPYNSVEEVKAAYQFSNLQSFLDIYHLGATVLQKEQDFFDMTWAYLERVAKDNVIHTEIFFVPQIHTRRGVSFDTVVNGIYRALQKGHLLLDISSKLILCFVREDSAEEAMQTLQQALEHKDKIIGVGLESAEVGNPPSKFAGVFEKALEEGLLTVAHAGEEGPAEYIWQALDLCKVSRIDHGVRCLDDEKLVQRLIEEQTPLTVCPLSNVKLKVFNTLAAHPLKKMLDMGLCVTINSDDPAYFGGYIGENFAATQAALGLTKEDLRKLTRNAFNASFVSHEERKHMLKLLDKLAFC